MTSRSERDPVLDLVRAASLVVVVVWHWAFTTIRWASDGPHVGNPIGEVRGLWLLTWAAQVMPLFFIVGGALHALDGRPAGEFVRNRLRRLIPPVLPILAGAAVIAAIAHVLGRNDVVWGVVLLITPLWFLAVYLVLVLVTPAARMLHRRFGVGVVVVGGFAVLAFDRAATAGVLQGGWVMFAQYALTWSVVHQLGFHLDALRDASAGRRLAVCLGGYAALAAGARWGGYPGSMVGVAGDPVSNMSPPNVMVLFLGIGQLGLLALADRPLRAFAERRRRLLGVTGAWSMTVYVWHMVAFVAFWAALSMVGIGVGSRVDAGWWLVRPLWLVGPMLIAVPLCAAVGRRAARTTTVAPVRPLERAP